MWWPKKPSTFTIKEELIEKMGEPQPLPMGVKEFHAWADRIISGALVPGATPDSQKFALADMILHLKPTEDHCPDAFFIKTLRKCAVNQVADAIRIELRDKAKARLTQEEEDKKLKLVDSNNETKVLADPKL
jgi:hypothetical protein